MEQEPIIYREEVTAILGVLADLNVHVRKILDLLREDSMAKKKRDRETPEERARWEENQRRLEQILERRLKEEGATRAEALQRLYDAKNR